MTKTLDLGCGPSPRNPFHADELFGVDVRENLSGTIRSADLVKEPIPFADQYFDYVTAFDFIEHMPRLVYTPERRNAFVELMNEIHRVLKPGGIFLSSTPAFPHEVAFRDPTHVNIITEKTFPMYFDDVYKWAGIYGFKGAFEIRLQEWRGEHLYTTLRKAPTVVSQEMASAMMPTLLSLLVPIAVGGSDQLSQALVQDLLNQIGTQVEIHLVMPETERACWQTACERDSRLHVVAAPTGCGEPHELLTYALNQVRTTYCLPVRALQVLTTYDWPRVLDALNDRPDAVVWANGAVPAMGGQEAVSCLLQQDHWTHGIWKTEILRTMAFSKFLAEREAWFYDRYRFLHASGRVAFLPDARVAKEAEESSPYATLRLAHWLFEQRYPQGLITRLRDDADAAASKLRPSGHAMLSPFDDLRAQAHTMGHLVPLTWWQRWQATMVRRSAKWKRSYQKRFGAVDVSPAS
jgi:hypothetical protein